MADTLADKNAGRRTQRRAGPGRWRLPGLRRLLRRRLLWWTLVGALTLVTATTIQREYARAHAARVDWGTTVAVFVATADIDGGDPVESAAALQHWPAALVPDTAITRLDRGARARVDLVAGEVLVSQRVSTRTSGGVTDLLPVDTVAVAVPVHVGVPPLSLGDRVDLLATYDSPGSADTTTRVARSAVVVDLDDDVITVAVADDAVAELAGALARAEVTIALTGR